MDRISKVKAIADNMPEDFKFTLATSGEYIFSGLTIPIYFDVILTDEKLGLKEPYGNLSEERIAALSHVLGELKVGEFRHRTYGINSTKWSIWELDYKENGISLEDVPDFIKGLRKNYTGGKLFF